LRRGELCEILLGNKTRYGFDAILAQFEQNGCAARRLQGDADRSMAVFSAQRRFDLLAANVRAAI
jgi:hypothetical protein